MGFRKISKDLKETALRLDELGWEAAAICDVLQISPASLYRWQALIRDNGTLEPPNAAVKGRPRIISRAVLTELEAFLCLRPETYLDELIWWLAVHHGLCISSSALHITLSEAGLTRKLLQKNAAERDEELR
ncbi:hypothetical protein K466DRAFT_458845, partial [Polyporus arcularius HHB13444]